MRKNHHKKFRSIYPEVLSVMWPDFTVVKCNSQISNIFHHIKLRKSITNSCSLKKAVLRNFAKFAEKHLCWSLFFKKSACLQSSNFIEKRLQHRCFTVNIAKFLRTPVLKNIGERPFKRFPTWTNNITSNLGSEEEIFSKTKQKNNILKLN